MTVENFSLETMTDKELKLRLVKLQVEATALELMGKLEAKHKKLLLEVQMEIVNRQLLGENDELSR